LDDRQLDYFSQSQTTGRLVVRPMTQTHRSSRSRKSSSRSSEKQKTEAAEETEGAKEQKNKRRLQAGPLTHRRLDKGWYRCSEAEGPEEAEKEKRQRRKQK
jgi:hypothetical protein